MWKQVGGSYFEQFKYLGEVIILCLGTRNSFAAIPGSIAGVKESLKTQDERIGIVIPLGVTLCRYGNVMTFSIGAIFAMQLYGFAIKPESILIIIVTSILASMATSGTPGIVSRTMIALVLGPLGIPSSAIIVILIALDPILDPIITLINVYPNCVAAASVVNKANA
jgi:proton glutamate symport protein